MPEAGDALLAEVVRTGFVESRHYGSLVALAPAGERVLARGAPDDPHFPRSSLKLLQAVAMLRTGMAEQFELDERHVAVAASSHSGEQQHIDVVRDLLSRADVPESALDCPRDMPLDEATQHVLIARGRRPARVHHNCSGKHAAMLATCAAMGWPLAGYRDPAHPLQVHVRATVEELAGPVSATGVDGCGAPVFAVSLTGLARAYGAAMRAAAGTPESRVADAMRAHPDLVGGTGRDVTMLMRAVPGLLAKDGAEGLYAAALADGTGIAVKIADGAARARIPVLLEALAALGVAAEELSGLARIPVLGGGEPVGEVRAVGIA